MPARRRIALSLMVIGGLLAAVLLTLLLFNLDRYRPEIIAYFEANTGKKTDIARVSLTFFPRVTVHIYGLGVKNPPPFPPGDVVAIAQADAVIDPWALLHGAVVIKSLVLKDLAIHLMSAPDGRWNFENPRESSSKNTFPMGIIDRVVFDGAQVTVSNLLPSGAVAPAFVEARDIRSELAVVNLAAIVNPSSPSLNGQGTWQAGRLRVGVVETTHVKSSIRLESWTVSIADVHADAYTGTIAGDFSLSVAEKNASVTADARISGIAVSPLLMAFLDQRPTVTGRLDADLKLAGEIAHTSSPMAGLQGSGHVRITDGDVPSLLANANVRKLTSFNDLGPGKDNPTAFASISADLQLTDLWMASKTITITGHGVDVDGSGRVRVSGSGDLDYRGVATITTKQGFWKNALGWLGGANVKDGLLSIAFKIEGTLENPKVSKAEKK